MIYDDVGSFPVPQGVSRGDFEEALLGSESWAFELLRESMWMKIQAGVQVPCYPQLRGMIDQFLLPLKDPEITEEPYLISEEEAVLPEIGAFRDMDLGGREIKMCVTGPLELCIAEFGNEAYPDVMMNMARSLNRIISASQSVEGLNIGIISIDEPSFGTNPNVSVDEEALVKAWDITSKTDVDVQIHLHSTVPVGLAYRSENIDVIDIGTAADPEIMNLINPELVDSYGKRIRIGVSRTDLSSVAAQFNENMGVNVWRDDLAMERFLNWVEPPSTIASRIGRAFERFGELLAYVGPDCGLGGAGSRRLAMRILKNTAMAMEMFAMS